MKIITYLIHQNLNSRLLILTIAGKIITELSNEYSILKSTIFTLIRILSPVKVSDTETVSLKEFKALQEEIRELEIENKILKKATNMLR